MAGPLCLQKPCMLQSVLHLVVMSYRFHHCILYPQKSGSISAYDPFCRPAAAKMFLPFSRLCSHMSYHPPYVVSDTLSTHSPILFYQNVTSNSSHWHLNNLGLISALRIYNRYWRQGFDFACGPVVTLMRAYILALYVRRMHPSFLTFPPSSVIIITIQHTWDWMTQCTRNHARSRRRCLTLCPYAPASLFWGWRMAST